MSLKLPNISKRESLANSPDKHEVITPPSPASPPPQQEEDYEEDDHFESFEDGSPAPAVETFTALKSKPESFKGELDVEVVSPKNVPVEEQGTRESRAQDLEQVLAEKLKTAGDLRLSVEQKKGEIKSIGDQIDKDLNKSLLKASKHSSVNSVNIRDIFSASPKSTSHKINTLNEQLKRTRMAIKKTKTEVQKIENGLTDPVALMNQDRGIDYKGKLRSTEAGIKAVQNEKNMLEEEIARWGKDIDQEEEKQKAEDLEKITQELYEIQNSQKEEKLKLYRIEKEDIIMMEKTKYYQEKDGHIGIKRQKMSQRERARIEEEMRQLISAINETMEERNKTESQKKQQAKHLTTEASALETKNWDLCNRLREIDAFLLQHYEKKTRKREKHMEKTIDLMEKSHSGKIETHTPAEEKLYRTKISDNDKNKTAADTPLVERKKNYEFGVKQSCESEINLSDDFLGFRLTLKSIAIKCRKEKILSISAKYVNSFGDEINGFTMGANTLPEDIEERELVVEKGEVINFVHTGYCEGRSIAFFHLVTSDGKEMKWGSLENLVKSEQKHIKRYESCFIKSKFLQPEGEQDEQFCPFFLIGFTLFTLYMSSK